MAHTIALIAGLIFLGGAFPTRWAGRIWLMTGIIGGTLILLAPNARWEDQGLLYGVAQGIFLAAMLITLFGIVARWLLARFVWPPLRPPFHKPSDETETLRIADQVIACVLGISSGLLLSLCAALTLRGAQGGLMLHLFVFGVAASTAAWVSRNAMGRARLVAGAALTIVAALAIMGGTVWPSMIRAQADSIMPGLPRCLRSLDRLAMKNETMLLTLPPGRSRSPGLILTVMAEDGARHFRWSYRANQFVRFEAYRFGDCPT